MKYFESREGGLVTEGSLTISATVTACDARRRSISRSRRKINALRSSSYELAQRYHVIDAVCLITLGIIFGVFKSSLKVISELSSLSAFGRRRFSKSRPTRAL